MYIPLLFALLITGINAKAKCPKSCVCDNFQNLRRVQCSNGNLVNIIGNIPQKVQVLDVSYNRIKEIDDHELLDLGLDSIWIFNISHNNVGHVHLNSFRGMDKLRTIDLSHNNLEYILLDWFYDLTDLRELYMNDNNFASLPDGPLLESNSLQKLDLSNSRISHVKRDAFAKLPNLEQLYLGQNSLIQLNVITVSSLQNLELLSLEDNPLNCDKTTDDLKEYLQKQNIIYRDSCNTKKLGESESEKFQRMMKHPEVPEDKNTWILDEEIENDIAIVYNCTKIGDAILIPFIVGIVFGLILGCNIQIRTPKNQRNKRPKRYSIIRRNHSDIYPLVLSCDNIYESTPIPQRRFTEVNSL